MEGDSVHFGQRVAPKISVEPPLELHTRQKPFEAKVLSVETLKPEGKDTPPGKADVIKLVFDITDSNFVKDGKAVIEPGHSLLVLPNIPEGKEYEYLKAFRKNTYQECEKLDLKNESHRPLLLEHRYSVADIHEEAGRVTLTMVVRRVEYEQGGEKKLGLLSNQLANLKPGDKITMFGPNTNRFTLPSQRDANMLIFSTGIAAMGPIQDFLQTRLEGQTGKLGETRLYTGYRNHEDEINGKKYGDYEKDSDKHFSYHPAFSRDLQNPQRVGEAVRKDGKKILDLLDKDNTYAYFCGVWGIEVTVISALLQAALENKRPIEDVLDRIQDMKKNGRWKSEGSRQLYRYGVES
jgi:Na+-transporting NADH:ubiquinone oxidoreductase subunit NqrF